MIILLMQGGIGNQVCQLVLADMLSTTLGIKLEVNCSLTNSRIRSIRNVTPRKISNIVYKYKDSIEINTKRILIPRLMFRVIDLIPLIKYGRGHYLSNKFFSEGGFNSKEISGNNNSTIYIKTDGTFSHIFNDRFNEMWDRLYKVLQNVETITSPDGFDVTIHIRGGDYKKKKTIHNTLPSQYYRRALESVSASTKIHTLKVLVCTDDVKHATYIIKDLDHSFTFSENCTPEQDLRVMMESPRLIIANSSLSAVAAHMGELKALKKQVIAPKDWFDGKKSLRNNGEVGMLSKSTWQNVGIEK